MDTRLDWALLERPALLARVRADADGCVVTGTAGVGKSTLVRHALEGAGRPQVTVRGYEGLAMVPFAALDAAMPDGAGGTDPASPDVVRRLRGWLRELAAAGITVVIDDADLLDPPSSGLLSYAAQTEHLAIVITVREGRDIPADLDRLALHQAWPTVVIEPWTTAEVAVALEATLGDAVDPALVEELHELSAGVPLVLRELVAEGVDGDRIREQGGRWSGRPTVGSPASAARLIGRRLPTAGPALTALQTLALAGQVRPALLDRLAPREVIVELDARGLLEFPAGEDAGLVRLSHPMLADALRSGIDEGERRELLQTVVRAAAEIDMGHDADRLQVLHWALEIGEPQPADQLRAGYRLALRNLDYALAADIAGALNAEQPSAEAMLFHAVALARAGRFDDAVTIAGQARDAAVTDDDVVTAARFLVRLQSELGRSMGHRDSQPDEAARTARWADEHLGGSSFATLLDAFNRFVAGDLTGALERGLVVVEGRGAVHPGIVAEADQFLVMTGQLAGRFDVARASQLRLDQDGEDGEAGLVLPAIMGSHGARVSMLMYDGRLREAYAEDVRAFAVAERVLAYDEMMQAAAQRGMRAYLMGDLDDAIASCELCLQYRVVSHSRTLLISGVLALALAQRGQTDRALQVLADTDLDRAEVPTEILQLDYDHLSSVARALAANGDPERHVQLIRAVAAKARGLGYHWLDARARLSLVSLGRATAEDRDAAQAIATSVDAPLLRGVAEAVVAAVDGDAARLEAIAERFAAMSAHLFAVDALTAALAATPIDANDSAADVTRRARLRARLDDAMEHCPGLQPVPIGRVPAPSSRVEVLTPREHEIAALAAAGMTSKEIGARLDLSPRTVDNNLRRVFAKLGVRDRRQLAVLLDP